MWLTVLYTMFCKNDYKDYNDGCAHWIGVVSESIEVSADMFTLGNKSIIKVVTVHHTYNMVDRTY